jgi:Domain of unknown function (DUF4145)
MKSFIWTCPHCSRPTTINSDRYGAGAHNFRVEGANFLSVTSRVIHCPNPECEQFEVRVCVVPRRYNGTSFEDEGRALVDMRILPSTAALVFPDYIPKALRDDYTEACAVENLSPKASATLSRRCLQGMLRDFWGVTPGRLYDEIQAIRDDVDSETWAAIDGLRSLGNIGAHMMADINVIVEVDPDEARLLIELVETLFTDWYVARHDRQHRMKKIADAAAAKSPTKS